MGLRCERCRTADLTLLRFGVYTCPNCGQVDADGNILADAGTSRADSTQPTVIETGRASFVAPPPPSAPLPAGSVAAAAPTGTRDLPGIFLATVAVLGLIDVAEAVHTRSVLTLVLQLGTMGALVTGKPWARTLAIAGGVLGIGLAAMLFVAMRGQSGYAVIATVVMGANAWWLYVLFRPDTVAYFKR